MKKLFALFSLVLILAALIAAPKPALGLDSCPLPGSSAYQYCWGQCTASNPQDPSCGSFGCKECMISCQSAMYFEAQQYCSQYHVCCNY